MYEVYRERKLGNFRIRKSRLLYSIDKDAGRAIYTKNWYAMHVGLICDQYNTYNLSLFLRGIKIQDLNFYNVFSTALAI